MTKEKETREAIANILTKKWEGTEREKCKDYILIMINLLEDYGFERLIEMLDEVEDEITRYKVKEIWKI